MSSKSLLTSSSEMKVLASSLERRISENVTLRELTVNKLQFQRVGLVGRETEKALLQDRLDSLMASCDASSSGTSPSIDRSCREFIAIRGVSGSGKSALAGYLNDCLMQKKRGVFCRGEFDQKASNEPYAAIIMACHELCIRILELKNQPSGTDPTCAFPGSIGRLIQDKCRKEIVGTEIELLLETVPALAPILKDEDATACNKFSNGVLNEGVDTEDTNLERRSSSIAADQSKELLENAFRKFLQIVSSCWSPMVLVLDDLQWCDIHTPELLKGILSDQRTNIMVVASYRSDQVDENHIVHRMVQDLKSMPQDSTVTEIEIGNLNEDESNQVLLSLLNMDDPVRTQPLANLCHRRTLGNPFFFMQYVDMLQRNSLLLFNFASFSWKWDLEEIKANTGATANAVDLMTEKILNCPPELIHLLKLASCLGRVFTGTVLFLVWAMSPSDAMDSSAREAVVAAGKDDEFSMLLENAVREDILERCEEGFHWVHDKVQEAAIGLELKEAADRRKYSVGRTLQLCLDDTELDEYLFCVVNLLNCGKQTSVKLAELNLRAAKKAQVFNATGVQIHHAEKGIENLPPDCWTSCKDLALNLHCIRAEAASLKGDLATLKEYCTTIFNLKECTILDKIPCYKVWIFSFFRRGKTKEAMDLTIDVLGMLGCKIPKSHTAQKFAAVMALIKLRQRLKNNVTKTDYILHLPLMTDPVQKDVMALLSILTLYSFLCKRLEAWVLSNLHSFDLTLQYGLANESQRTFASCGTFAMHVMGDWKLGAPYAELGVKIYDRLRERSMISAAMTICYGLVNPWTQPMQAQLRFLMQSYQKGMEYGDINMAFGSIILYVEQAILSGRNLEAITEDIQIYLPQFEAMKANVEFAARCRCFWQLCLNLMGKSDNTFTLEGSAVPDESTLSEAKATTLRDIFFVMKMFLCVYFGEHEKGSDLALERNSTVYSTSPGVCSGMVDSYLRALSLYAMARKCKKGLYKNQANAARSRVQTFVKKGNPNLFHGLELLNAERASLSKSPDTPDLYSRAARSALRSGCIHDAALASERHAEYLLDVMKNEEGAAAKMQEAMERYSEWGAKKKVDQLRSSYPYLYLKQ